MTSGRIGRELALLTILCVLLIFLFPVSQGPYSTTNGPVTALRAVRAAQLIYLCIAVAALTVWHVRRLSLQFVALHYEFFAPDLQSNSPEQSAILRC